ncbi:MAG: hypothetical protein DCC71_14370 [Proteobacteria bacterium]|nr:MAG: hypothetical protein DCC71_14370 [Pseudomonadota bacterium]
MGANCDEPRLPRPDARVESTLPGSCDGFLDYGDELRASGVRLGWVRPSGIGRVEAEFHLLLENTGGARFRSASAVADVTAAPQLSATTGPEPVPADFGPIGPFGAAWSTAPLLIDVPAVHFAELVALLGDGTIPLVVSADEENVLAPGVRVLEWSATEDRMYALAGQPSGGYGGPPNPDPGSGPFAPGEQFGVSFVEFSDDTSTVFDHFAPGETLYLVENPDSPLGGENDNIPDAYDQVRVVDAVRQDDEDDGYTLWNVTLARTDAESLPDIFSTASFCTGTSTHVDPPVQASRLFSLDGDVVPDAEREANGQPLRANRLTFTRGAVTFSGQIAGHVLKPSLSLRLRDGHVEAGADFDTDISFTAELRAEDEVEIEPETQTLWEHCFPMPSLPAGPVTIPMSLQLLHDVGIEGRIGAGVVVGFQKRFESGFSVLCEGGPGVPEQCTSAGRRAPTPIQLTPPQLTDATGFEMRTETTLHALLRLGSAHPECETGPGLSLDTTAYAKAMVAPTQDPWWESAYGLEVTAALDLDLLGLDVARYDTEVFSTEDGASSSDAFPTSPEPPGARTSGADQRWAVAIDDTAVPNGVDTTDVVALPDGSSLAIATEAIGGRNPLVKLDRFGSMLWAKRFDKKVLRLRALPDGTAVALGANAWIARVDADGDLLWSFDAEISRQDLAFARCVLADVVPIETAPGVYDYVGVGRMGSSIVTQVDACAFRVNADGTLAWSRIYVGERGQRFDAAVGTRDGHVVAVGSDHWSYVGNRSIPLLVKLDPATGDVAWWKGLPMTRIASLHGVAEADDGTLYAVGNAQGVIYSTGAAIVARIAPDGSDARHALLFQDEDWETLQDDGWNGVLDFEPWVDTAGGDTAYDTLFDIAPSGGGFVVVGNTGLGTATAARAAKLNANLGVEWITTFDGASTDGLHGVAAMDDALLVSGHSASLPEADGGSGENQLWVMKLPFTGALELLPAAGVTVRFVSPGVRYASADPGVNPLADAAIDGAWTEEAAVLVSSGPNPALLTTTSTYCAELLTATGHTTTTDACPDP